MYRNVTVYVRLLTGAERPPERDPADPDFNFVKINGNCHADTNGTSCSPSSTAAAKRMKIMNGNSNGVSPGASTNGHANPGSDFVRRSNRRQKVRGEREFTISSDMLLRDLKVKVGNYINPMSLKIF